MKFTQKFVAFLVAISLSSGLWGMNDAKEDPKVLVLPEALVSLCFTYLDVRDFAKVPLVCSLWKTSVTEKLWKTIGMRLNGVITLRYEDRTWKKAVRDWVMIPSHVLSMGTWERREIEYAISDEGFALLQGRLLDNLGKTIVKKMKSRIISSKDSASLFIAYYVVDMSATWDAAGYAAGNAAWDAAGYAAGNAAWIAAWHAAWHAAREATWYAAKSAAENAAYPTLIKVINILEIKDARAIGGAAYKLSSLYILAYISRDKYFTDFFEKSFLAAKRQLEKEGFSKSTDEILSIISSATWANEADPSLAQNPHIMTLKAVFMELNPDMKEIRHAGLGEEHVEEKVVEENVRRRKSSGCCVLQ